MADKSKFGQSAPPAGAEAPDADPFAELTRIMGFDPRAQGDVNAQTDSLSDEQFVESLGEIDASAATPIAADVAAEVSRQVSIAQGSEELSDDFGIDLERELMGDFLASEPVSATTGSSEDDEAFEAAFADELVPVKATDSEAQADLDADVVALNRTFGQAEASELEVSGAAPMATSDEGDDEFDAVFASEIGDEQVEEALVAPTEAPIVASSDTSDFELDFDLDDIDSAIEREMEQALGSDLRATDAVSAADDDDMFDSALADSFNDFAVDAADAAPVVAADAFADLERDLASGLDLEGLNEVSKDAPRPEAPRVSTRHVAGDEGLDDLIAALEAASARSTKKETSGSVRSASNEDSSSAAAKMSDHYQTRNDHDFRPRQGHGAPRVAAPEIETTEMYDRAHSMVDDLDLPDVAYDEPVHAGNEIDLEFDNLLNEMSRGEPATRQASAPRGYDQYASHDRGFEPAQAARQPASPSYEEDYSFDSVFAQPEDAAARRQPDSRAPHPQAQQAYQNHADDFSDFDFDDSDFGNEGDLPANPAYRNHDRGGRGGRGMMIAALVGGVALLGGIGAFAMNWGGDSGAPALVQADGSPMKIRPENPGGSSVPHQDSAVYDTVSRSGGGDQPVQQRLVSGTEEPMAIPQPNDSEDDELAALTKGEDRIQPTEASADAAQDPLAVAPRKVRTMVVKPDGTLVPADEPAVNAAAEPTVEDIANTPVGEPELITTGATRAVPAKVAAAAPVVAGGWSVQVASQPSEAGASKSMADISKRYGNVIGNRGANIVKAEVEGKGTYWRVRVAAASRDDAVSLCSNLKSAGGSCFVTR